MWLKYQCECRCDHFTAGVLGQRSGWRRCATSQTVPGSILGCVPGFFIDIFPSDRTMTLGSTQPIVKMSTRNIPGGKGGRCVRLTTSLLSHAECHEIWEPKPGTLWATPGLLRDCFTFYFTAELRFSLFSWFNMNATGINYDYIITNYSHYFNTCQKWNVILNMRISELRRRIRCLTDYETLSSGSRKVLRGSQGFRGIRHHFPAGLWIYFCNGCFQAYLFIFNQRNNVLLKIIKPFYLAIWLFRMTVRISN